jgi:hypothetical protein
VKAALLFVMFWVLLGCKAQSTFTNLNKRSETVTDADWIGWYNTNVKQPKYDTVTVFKVPDFSKLRYVIVYPLGVARVELSNGRFIEFIEKGHMWLEQVSFNAKGEVVGGMRPVMISSLKEKGLVVQYEECEKCKFKPPNSSEL